MSRKFAFYGDNAKAYNSREPEILLAGPAGTGKTLAWLAKILTVAGKYPGSRILITRKTRESLTETVLVTWERAILGPDHPVLTKNPTLRRVRQNYQFPNGSTVVCGGMDKPDKVLSSEFDLIYCPEVTELSLVDWETLGGRLRAGAMPYQQIVGDCNPTSPTHWLFKRQSGGHLRMYASTHKDNPRYFNRKTGEWTDQGREYVQGRLQRMTGPRRKRFLEGIWAVAEGLVYDGYAPATHNLPAGWMPPRDWPRVWSIDFGYTNPFVLQFWAIDGDGRLYLYREYYRTRQMVETVGKWAAKLIESGDEPVPQAVVCDHDPENAAVFERYSGQRTTPAEKFDKWAGIQQVQARFDLAGDGKPRIFLRPDLHPVEMRDGTLLDAGKPVGVVEELSGYVWDTANPDRIKDEPVEKENHGCDAALYCVRWADSNAGGDFDYSTASNAGAESGLPGGTFSGRQVDW